LDALNLLVNENRGVGDLVRLSDVSGMFGTPCKKTNSQPEHTCLI
jgi:hypothetical protein